MTAAAPAPGRFAGDVLLMFRCGSPFTGRGGTNRGRTDAPRFREPVDEAALAGPGEAALPRQLFLGKSEVGGCGRKRRIGEFAQVRRPAAKPLAGRVEYNKARSAAERAAE